ncbi:MAG TPA: hypothetical protein VK403_14485, partial [Allosphingosinicella sp.]|nr:hypothetical protein [Allosphingosinicella sp.]
LCDYYDRAFEDALTAHVPAFFGLPRPGSDPRTACALLELQRAVTSAVTTGLQLTDRLPYPTAVRDPGLELAESLFRSLRVPGVAPPALASCFRKVVDAGFATPRGKTMPRWFFEARAAMACLKRLHFALVFCRGRLIGEGSVAVLSGAPKAIGRMIDEWIARMDWVFPPDWSTDSITLFQSESVKLTLRSDRHVELRQGPAVQSFHAADGMSELRAVWEGLDESELTLPGHYGYPAIPAFSFRRGIDSMLDMAALLAREEQARV